MSDGIVIDANIIPQFSQELRKDAGHIYEIITWLSQNCGIATNDYISNEWDDVCSDHWFQDWYTDELKNGRIRKINSKRISFDKKKTMRIKYGFPTNSTDYQYIVCAYSTKNTKYIMTENYHFYDPKCLRQTIHARRRSRDDRNGLFCSFLINKLGIRVGMPNHCVSDFDIC